MDNNKLDSLVIFLKNRQVNLENLLGEYPNPCKPSNHEWEPVKGWHICQRCSKKRGLVLISDIAYRSARRIADEMRLRPQAWKYIPSIDFESRRFKSGDSIRREREIKLRGILVESEDDLIGWFDIDERAYLLRHLQEEG